uniref:Uncharacterized protein n=1 Tax=Arundo donax TaxID=35708 RepID=A0A0A8ZSL7_ARUDO
MPHAAGEPTKRGRTSRRLPGHTRTHVRHGVAAAATLTNGEVH